MAENVTTPEFRVSFPKVFEPEKNDLNGKMEYSVVALFPVGADLSELKKMAKEAADKKWPHGVPDGTRNPFRNQGEKVRKNKDTGQPMIGDDGKPVLQDGCVDGAVFMNFKTTQRPGLVNQSVKPILDQSEFYSGCHARATVRAYAYEIKGNKGVAFGLQNIQKLRDGEPLGGRTNPENDFAPVATADGGDAGGMFD